MIFDLKWWWLIYERCSDCDEPNCLMCQSGRHLTLRMVQSAAMPDNALIGPADSKENLLARLGPLFRVDDDGQIYFHVSDE